MILFCFTWFIKGFSIFLPVMLFFFFFLFHLTLPINLVADGTGRYVLRCIYRWFTLSCSASDKITT